MLSPCLPDLALVQGIGLWALEMEYQQLFIWNVWNWVMRGHIVFCFAVLDLIVKTVIKHWFLDNRYKMQCKFTMMQLF